MPVSNSFRQVMRVMILLPEKEASLLGVEIDGEILPRLEVGFHSILVVEAARALAVAQTGFDRVRAGGGQEFLVGSRRAVPREAGRRQNVLVDRPPVDAEFDDQRNPLSRTGVWPTLGGRE